MAIDYKRKIAVFHDLIGVDEAEGLLDWLQQKRTAKVDLATCTHLHPANLQVLMAARPAIVAWPEIQALRAWLEPALKP